MNAFLSDIAPSGGSLIAGAAAAAIFLLLVGIAAVTFFALRKTLKIAFRLAIVAVILVIALAGSISLWYFSSGSASPKPRTPANGRR
jgi:membrane protein implicated in regulation of membrane protease activity